MDAFHERLTSNDHLGQEKALHTRVVLTFCTALVIGGALIAGSAHALGKADDKAPINDKDEAITIRVNEQIAKDAYLKQSGVQAQVNAEWCR